MKKNALLIFVLLICLLSFSACKDTSENTVSEQKNEQQKDMASEQLTEKELSTEQVEPQKYKAVDPTQEELDNMHFSLSILFSHFLKDYDSEKDDAYTKLFCKNELLYFYVPRCYDEIKEFVSAPLSYTNEKPRWNKSVLENDPLGRFTGIPQEAFDENGVFDEKYYLEYLDPSADLTTMGYTVFDADFVEWLVEGVWNGTVDHEKIHRFADYEWLYYYNNNYIASACGMVDETQTTYYSAIEYVKPLGVQKYEVAFNVYHIYNRRRPAYYTATAVIGMKEAPSGFRFWSIYSIDYEKTKTDDNDLMSYGIPFGLFYEYGDSVIYPEQDDYSYIRINFDESREISGYWKIDEGVIIDSNGKVYSEIEDESILEMQGSRYPDIPEPEGVDYIYDSPYNSDLLKFSKDGKYGYLNTDGEIVIEAQFDEASDFSEGLAAVCREIDGCLEYINENGETVLKLEDADGYINIFTLFPDEPNCDFSDGFAMINGGEYYIDKDGNRIVIENACGMYNNGLVIIRDPETHLQGYADINGNIVIPCKYIWARDFLPCGVALVFTADYYEPVIDAYHPDMRYCGYVNKNGEEIIPLEFYTPYYVGASGLYPMPSEKDGIINVYKEGFNYYYRYDGTLLGKRPHMMKIPYGDEWYNINLAEYWQWVNDGKPVG